MSTTATGDGSPTGSNPAGVASPNTPEDTASPDRTELRSVPTDEDRRKPVPGDRVEVEVVSEARGLHWRPAKVLKLAERFFEWESQYDDGSPFAGLTGYDEQDWRWPGDGGPLLPAEPPAVPEPEVRRCTFITTGHDVDTDYSCGAVVGRSLHCDLCRGERCYEHCKGVDHFGGRLVSRGGTDHFDWKVVEVAAGRFMGQLWERMLPDGRPELRTVVAGLSERATVEQLSDSAKVYERSWLQMPEPPGVELGDPRGGRFPGSWRKLNAGLFDLLAASEGKLSAAKRSELLHEVIEWLRGCEDQWGVHGGGLPHGQTSVREAKALHDRQIVELFSRLAGAL